MAIAKNEANRREEALQDLGRALAELPEEWLTRADDEPYTAEFDKTIVRFASISNALAQVHWDSGESTQAIATSRKCCDRLERVVASNPLSSEPILVLGNSYNRLAFYLTATSDKAALAVFEQSMPLLERATAIRPQDVELRRELAEAYAMRGEYWLQERESLLALKDIDRALEINQERRKMAADSRDVVDLLIEGYKSRGILLRRVGRTTEAAEAYRQGIALIEDLQAENRASRETLRSKAGITNNLAYLYQSQGLFEEALEPYKAAASLYAELAEDDVVRIEYYYQASSITNLGATLGQLGEVEESLACFNESIRMLEVAREMRPDNRMLMQFLFESYVYRSEQLDKQNSFELAKADLSKALSLEENQFSDVARLKLMAVDASLGNYEDGIEAASNLIVGKPSDFWLEASRIAARAANFCLDASELSEEEREQKVNEYATLAAAQVEHAMNMDRFLFVKPDVLPNLPEHKRLWDRPEYEPVRALFVKQSKD